MLIVQAITLQSVATIVDTLNKQHYTMLAKRASESGVAMAAACLRQNDNTVTWTGKNLTPWTNCNGDSIDSSYPCQSDPNSTDSRCWFSTQTNLRTTFSVPPPTTAADGKTRQLTANATVEQLRTSNGASWRTTSYSTRAQSGSLNVATTSTSNRFACSLLDTSQLYCWGYNVLGAMGPAVPTDSTAPSRVDTAPVFTGKTITSISPGSFDSNHMCAIASGDVYCWGSNISGQLGDGTATGGFAMSPDPVRVSSGGSEAMPAGVATKVVVGSSGSCAIAAGKVYCWGNNRLGTLGNNNSSMQFSAKPVAVTGLPSGVPVTDLSYTMETACAVAGGNLYCWGGNRWTQVGDGTGTDRFSAVQVGGLLSGKTVTMVQTSHATTCALANGELYCWGVNMLGAIGDGTTNNSATPVKVVNGSGTALNGKTIVQLSSGYHYNCARTSDGKVYCWGANYGVGQLGNGSMDGYSSVPVEVSGLAAIGPATSLSSSRGQSCVVINAGNYCWGSAFDGQMRSGVQIPTAVSMTGPFSGSKTPRLTATGGGTSCGAMTDGTIGCWGRNSNGSVGDGTYTYRTTPSTTGSFTGKSVTSLSMGDGTGCTVASGEFWCWGQNIAGKIGNDTLGDTPTPARVSTSGVLSGKSPQSIVSPGAGVVCGIASGAAYCWGGYAADPIVSLLGNNMVVQAGGAYYSKVPVQVYQENGVLAGKTVTQLGMGTQACALAGGSLYCWGTNSMGQLGTGAASDGSSKPVTVLTESGVLAGKTITNVAGGANFFCASTSEPNVYCWGYNYDGQYGNTNRTTVPKPTLVTLDGNALKGKTITKLSAGQSHVCAITSDGQLYCWGYNAFGQLGDGTNTNRYSPVRISGPLDGKTVTDISLNDQNTCAVAGNTLYCWGNNDYGQIGNGNAQASASPVPTKSLRIPPLLQY